MSARMRRRSSGEAERSRRYLIGARHLCLRCRTRDVLPRCDCAAKQGRAPVRLPDEPEALELALEGWSAFRPWRKGRAYWSPWAILGIRASRWFFWGGLALICVGGTCAALLDELDHPGVFGGILGLAVVGLGLLLGCGLALVVWFPFSVLLSWLARGLARVRAAARGLLPEPGQVKLRLPFPFNLIVHHLRAVNLMFHAFERGFAPAIQQELPDRWYGPRMPWTRLELDGDARVILLHDPSGWLVLSDALPVTLAARDVLGKPVRIELAAGALELSPSAAGEVEDLTTELPAWLAALNRRGRPAEVVRLPAGLSLRVQGGTWAEDSPGGSRLLSGSTGAPLWVQI